MDMRRAHRFKINQEVTVTRVGAPGNSQPARLANFSASGAALILGREVQPGAALRIKCGRTMLFGTVMHCTAAGKEFSVGVELEEALYESSPTAARSRPQPQRESRRAKVVNE